MTLGGENYSLISWQHLAIGTSLPCGLSLKTFERAVLRWRQMSFGHSLSSVIRSWRLSVTRKVGFFATGNNCCAVGCGQSSRIWHLLFVKSSTELATNYITMAFGRCD